MQLTDKIPQPKFQIGQRVRVKESYSFKIIDRVYIVVQIMLSCISVLVYPGEKNEPYDYMLLFEEDLGKPCSKSDILWNIRESFIVGVE